MLPRLVSVVRDDEADPPVNLTDRRLPVIVDDMRAFIAVLDDPCSLADLCDVGDIPPAPMSLKSFTSKLHTLHDAADPHALNHALTLPFHKFNSYLKQFVPCVGCRRCVEKLMADMGTFNYGALWPFTLNLVRSADVSDSGGYEADDFELTIDPMVKADTKRLHRFLIANHGKCRAVLDSLTWCKKSRCNLHNLDAQSCKAGLCSSWQELFSVMAPECREECGVVEAEGLHDMLETYLTKHRFCPECKNKLTRAYQCLTGGVDVSKERGYNQTLYSGLRYCKDGDHLHARACVNYMDSLIERAQVELAGNTRERHAKTLEIGQIEVLTCLGLYLHGRLHRLSTCMRTVHHSYHLLYCSAVCAMASHFQSYMESRDGLVNFDRLCAELQIGIANPNEKTKQKKKKKSKQKAVTSAGGQERHKQDKTASDAQPCSHTKRNTKPAVDRTQALASLTKSISELKLKEEQKKVSVPRARNRQQQQQQQHVSPPGSQHSTDGQPSPPDSPRRQKYIRESAVPLLLVGQVDPVTNRLVSELYPHRRIKRALRRFSSHADQQQQQSTPKSGDRRRELTGSPTSSPSDLGYGSSRDTSPNNATVSPDADKTGNNFSSVLSEISENHEETDVEVHVVEVTDSASDDGSACSLSSCSSEAAGGVGQPNEPPQISAQAIEWLQRNRSSVSEQRRELRAHVWQQFRAMQARMQQCAAD